MEARITIRTDNEIKESAEALFQSLGMNLSTAINVFLNQALRVGGIPFEIKVDKPNEETLKAMREAEEIAKTSKGYSSIEELRKALGV